MHPLVLHITDTIHAQVSVPFAQENRTHSNSSDISIRVRHWKVDFAEIVDKPGDREDIQCAESTVCTRTLRVVVIAVYREDRYPHIEVWVLVVYSWKSSDTRLSA